MKYVIVCSASNLGEIEIEDSVQFGNFILYEGHYREIIEMRRLVGNPDYRILIVSNAYENPKS